VYKVSIGPYDHLISAVLALGALVYMYGILLVLWIQEKRIG